jgi:hypothetical protein
LLGIDQTDVVQALAGQTGEWLALPTNNDGRQASFLDPTEGVLFPEEIEESEDQLASRLQIHWGFPDHPIQDRPPIVPPIVRCRLILSYLSTRGRWHLRRIRQDKIKHLTGNRRKQISQSHIDLHLKTVQERIAPGAPDACLDDIGGDNSSGAPGSQESKEATAGPEIENAPMRQGGNLTGEQQRAGLGGLGAFVEPEH